MESEGNVILFAMKEDEEEEHRNIYEADTRRNDGP